MGFSGSHMIPESHIGGRVVGSGASVLGLLDVCAFSAPLGASFCFALYAGLRSEDHVMDIDDTAGGWQS